MGSPENEIMSRTTTEEVTTPLTVDEFERRHKDFRKNNPSGTAMDAQTGKIGIFTDVFKPKKIKIDLTPTEENRQILKFLETGKISKDIGEIEEVSLTLGETKSIKPSTQKSEQRPARRPMIQPRPVET